MFMNDRPIDSDTEAHGNTLAGDVHLGAHVRETLAQFLRREFLLLDQGAQMIERDDELGLCVQRRAIGQVAERVENRRGQDGEPPPPPLRNFDGRRE